MMHNVVPLFILLVAYLPGHAQQFGELPSEGLVTRSVGDSVNNARSGAWEGFYANDVPAYRGSYADGERSGSWTFYHKRGGKTHSTGWFTNGIRDSTWTFYYEDEKPWAKGNYARDLMQGEWQFSYPTGAKMANVHFLNGDGTKLGKTGMPSNGREGPLIAFQEDGDTLDVQHWTNGELNGPYRSCHANGKPWKIGVYTNGEQEGQWIEYHENGQRIDVADYSEGKIVGDHQQFDPATGKLTLDLHMEDGSTAYERKYDRAGALRWEVLYERGRSRAVERSWYPGSDRLMKETWYALSDQKSVSLSHRDSLSRTWWSNGQLRSEEPQFEGDLNGMCTQFHENGQIQQQAGYVKGVEHGPYKRWYANGQLEAEGTMNHGERNGPWRSYSLDGTLAEEGNYQNGVKVGRWQELLNGAYDLGAGAYRVCNYNQRGVESGELLMYDAKGTKRLQGTLGDLLLSTGIWTQWHSNGALRSVTDHGTSDKEQPCGYGNGKLIELRDSSGHVLFAGGSGEVIDRVDGAVRSKQFYRDGCRDGTWVVYLDRILVSTVDIYVKGRNVSSYSLESADWEMNDAPSEAKKVYVALQRERFNGLPWQQRDNGVRSAIDPSMGSGTLRPADLVVFEHFMTTSLAEPIGMEFKDGSPYTKELIEGKQLLLKEEFKGITPNDLTYGQSMVLEIQQEVAPRSFREWEHKPCSAYYLVFRLDRP